MAKMVERECLICGKSFPIKESQLKHGKGRHCSLSCAGKAGNIEKHGTEIKDPHYDYKKKYREDNPEKTKVHRLIQKEYRNGRIKKAPCVVCGSVKSEAHHENYSDPYDIIWLCKKHHNQVRKTNPTRTG